MSDVAILAVGTRGPCEKVRPSVVVVEESQLPSAFRELSLGRAVICCIELRCCDTARIAAAGDKITSLWRRQADIEEPLLRT